MNVTKHGKDKEEKVIAESFICENCGCEFTAKENEFYVEHRPYSINGLSATYFTCGYATDKYICSCPECHKIIVKEKQKYADITSDTYFSTTDCQNAKNEQ